MRMPERTVAVALRIYRLMLLAYPPQHRRHFGTHMAQLFADQCRDAMHKDGPAELLRLWLRTLLDFAITLSAEWSITVKTNLFNRINLALLLLAVPLLFVTYNVLAYELNITAMQTWLNPLFGNPLFETLFTIVILVSLPATLLLLGLPLLRTFQVRRDSGHLHLSLAIKRPGLLSSAGLALGLLLTAIIAAYLVAENWQCIIGLAVSC